MRDIIALLLTIILGVAVMSVSPPLLHMTGATDVPFITERANLVGDIILAAVAILAAYMTGGKKP